MPLSKALLHSPSIWLMAITTASVLSSWFELRKVSIETQILSSHTIRLDFNTSPLGKVILGTAVRISTCPLLEWHTFATITQPRQDGFSVIVSKAGDWTSRLFYNPPTSLYIRGLPTFGFMRVVPLFRSILLVATRSGIALFLPHIYAQEYATRHHKDQSRMPKLRILWSAPSPEEIFGKDIVDLILRVDPYAVIHDTRSMGRPDMLAATWRLLRESRSEAVAVVGNKHLTNKVVYEVESQGVPVFGQLWHS
jgi:NAD(P)H-flavin reductase